MKKTKRQVLVAGGGIREDDGCCSGECSDNVYAGTSTRGAVMVAAARCAKKMMQAGKVWRRSSGCCIFRRGYDVVAVVRRERDGWQCASVGSGSRTWWLPWRMTAATW